MSVRRSKTVHTETVSKEININHNKIINNNCNSPNNSNSLNNNSPNNNLKNINCINNHLKYIEHSDKNSYCCTIDKTIKRILPITVDSSTILSPTALTAAQNSAQNSNKYLLTELNNYRKPPTIQVPVATILNDLSPVPSAPAKSYKSKLRFLMRPMNHLGISSNSPDVKAMRYYRLWIYTCNAVLLMAVIIFCGVAGKVLLADYRRLLINGLNLTQPSFVYAYLALLVQSGFLQLIGCLGALRLSEKLLNAYWLLLLVLLIGDAILGIFWMFKFDRIMQDLQPMLRYRLSHEYGITTEFTELWDRLQHEGRCCGIIESQDFSVNTNRTYPPSCCDSVADQISSISQKPLASAVIFRTDDERVHQRNLSDIAEVTYNHVTLESMKNNGVAGAILNSDNRNPCHGVHPQGCIDVLIQWLRQTADILFVLGYCVIAFLKLCFLGILRYEIKEMIQKIKLLQTEMAQSILNSEMGEPHILQIPVNGGMNIHTEPKVGNRDRELTRIGSAESERESLLYTEATPQYTQKHKQLYACMNEHGRGNCGNGTGCDSDTNSNSALIADEVNTATTSSTATKTINGNGNNNNNNNYELSEFDTKTSTYRLLNAPTVTKI
ncbi:uncharacterized protein [Chironomus tepperi]|uniref:uncharacterized protein n=1 Tax=Chironomus tepperi TaxID=113505 RepID=UPI00391F20E0